MADEFRSPQLTFNRAQHHIRDFQAIIDNFVNEQPWIYDVDRHSGPGNHIHKIKFTKPLPDTASGAD